VKKKVIFLTVGGKKTGYGHITRCCSLAHEFRLFGYKSDILVETDNLEDKLPSEVFRKEWNAKKTSLFLKTIKNAAGIIIDSYSMTESDVHEVQKVNPRVAVIDDWHHNLYKNCIVIDWSIGAESSAYPVRSPDVNFLLGIKYCSIRPDFQEYFRRRIPQKPHRIMVTFGGSDVCKLTPRVLNMLQKKYPDIEKHVVIGPGVDDVRYVELMKDKKTSFYLGCNAREMRRLMINSDIAICAGGQTLYEMASQGTPAIVVDVAENQGKDSKIFADMGYAKTISRWNISNINSKIAASISTLMSEQERSSRSQIGKKYVDGKGGRRLVKACLKFWNSGAMLTESVLK